MAQRSNSRIDRFAQMSKQEELIAKKRQEILEKQRTAELAKKVAAQMLAVKVASGFDENSFSTENEDKSDEEIKKTETETNLGGKVQTNTSLTSKTGKISFGVKRATVTAPPTEQPPTKIQNSFCNDGSFLENFKKILEKQQQQQKQQQPPQSLFQVSGIDDLIKTEEDVDASEGEMQHIPEPMIETTTPPISETSSATLQQHQHHHVQEQQHHHQQQQQQQQQQHKHQMQQQTPTLIPPPPAPPATVSFAFNAALMAPQNQILITQPVTDPNVAAAAAAYFGVGTTAAPPPPPTPTTIAAMLMPMHAVSTAAAPPPPPPPQLPMALATLTPLYMIPAPEPLQLNAIPQPKEFDLNAIPKPQLNLEVIQVPAVANEQPSSTVMEIAYVQEENHHQQQQQQQQIQIIAEESELQRQQLSPLQLQINNNEQEQQQQQIINNNNNNNNEREQHQQQQQQQQHQQQHSQTKNSSNINLQQQQQQDQQQQQQQLLPAHQVLSDDIYTNNNNNNNTSITTTVTTTNDDNTDGILTQMPTTLENLIDLVADNGDAYEETLRGHKNILHPAMWFICDKDSEAYHHYRQQVIDRRREKLKEQQRQEQAERELEKHIPRRHPCSMEEDKYDPESVISADNDSDDEYRRGMMDRNRDNIKRRIECRNELSEEERQEREAEEREAQRRQEKKKLRKSRWGGKVAEAAASVSAGSALTSNTSPSSSVQSSFANQNKPLLTAVTRNDPALLQYAKLNYGSINLSEEDWKKCEEHYKVNLLYQDMMRKRQEIDRLARSGKFKYEYDSDEDVSGGTWEHKLRDAEMEATKAWATALTKQSEGKHHIGDFLPPEELKKFMEQYEAKKNNRQPDLSDYKEYKLKEDNKGFQMLQKLGWKEGQGLGQDGEGIVDPINKGTQREGNQGLGVQNAATPDDCDNEYDAYRKRMMLAYRFRPNPLNNPRRAYY